MTPLGWVLRQDVSWPGRRVILAPGRAVTLKAPPGRYLVWTDSTFLVAVQKGAVPKELRGAFQGVAESQGRLTVPQGFIDLMTQDGPRVVKRLNVGKGYVAVGFVLAPEWFVPPKDALAEAVDALETLRRVAHSAVFYPDEAWVEFGAVLDRIIQAGAVLKKKLAESGGRGEA